MKKLLCSLLVCLAVIALAAPCFAETDWATYRTKRNTPVAVNWDAFLRMNDCINNKDVDGLTDMIKAGLVVTVKINSHIRAKRFDMYGQSNVVAYGVVLDGDERDLVGYTFSSYLAY